MFGAIRSRRGRLLAGCASWVLSAGTAAASIPCDPPLNLRVCQDRYGLWDPGDESLSGGVFLRWENQAPYCSVRLFVGGTLAAEMDGHLEMAFLDHIPLEEQEFTVEGECEGVASLPARVHFEVLAATPYEDPVPPFKCSFDGLTTIQVEIEDPLPRFEAIEVFRRKAYSSHLIHVMTVPGDTRTIAVADSKPEDTIFLQFFDGECYGSRLVGCDGPCLPVRNVRVCQDRYGDAPRVFVDWLPEQSPYTRFEVSLDGEKAAEADGWRGLAYIRDLELGEHTFGVKGFCQETETDEVFADFDVIYDTRPAPIDNLECRFNAVEYTIDGTWLESSPPSRFIDVYLRQGDPPRLNFVKTIGGGSIRVKAGPAVSGSELVLQFFNEECYGSPLLSCQDDGMETERFFRADTTGDGTVNLSDSAFSLNYLFLGSAKPLCLDAADANDDGGLDIADPIFTLSFLFAGGSSPLPPGPATCGTDPTSDGLQRCLTATCSVP